MTLGDKRGTAMRYQVRYVKEIKSWAVVDTKVGDRVIELHDEKQGAHDAAWYEEERWYKCSPVSDGAAA